MGTIRIVVDAGVAGIADKTFTVTNANLGRLVDWAKTMGGPGAPALTNVQAMERWMQWIMDMSRMHLTDDERRKATIPDFTATAP